MIEYLVINVCLGSDSLCQRWLKQNCKKKEKVQVLKNNNNRKKHSSRLRPRFQLSFGTKINTHAATAGSTTRYIITSEIARSRLSGQWEFRGESSHGQRKERRREPGREGEQGGLIEACQEQLCRRAGKANWCLIV